MKKFISSCLIFWAVCCQLSLAQPSAETTQIVVESGEQLGTIAERYLKRPAYIHWPEIAKLNRITDEKVTIYPGQVLRIPTRLLEGQPKSAKWLSITGTVHVVAKDGEKSTLAHNGDQLQEGARVVVGADSFGVFELPDGSQVRLLAGTHFVLDESRYFRGRTRAGELINDISGTKSFSGLMRLIQGAVETRATTANDRAKPLRIQTPTTVVGVRGTDFRVSHTHAEGSQVSGATPIVTRAEVVQGLVLAALDEQRKVDVPAGYGVALDPQNLEIPKPRQLLDAPVLKDWPTQHATPTVALPALPATAGQGNQSVPYYRIQAARDQAMRGVFINQKIAAGQAIQFNNVPEGTLYMMVRGIDVAGLEGKDAHVTLEVRKPVVIPAVKPKELAHPQDVRGAVAGDQKLLRIRWNDQSSAQSYDVQVSKSPEFLPTSAGFQQHRVSKADLEVAGLDAGIYFVRCRAIGEGGTVSAWSPPASMDVPRGWSPILVFFLWMAIAL